MSETLHLSHEFGPIYDKNSRVLILGSFPSVKSRELAFYYGHPQNRFWRILRCLDNPALEKALANPVNPHQSCALPDLSNTPGVNEFFQHNPEAVQLLHQFTKSHAAVEHSSLDPDDAPRRTSPTQPLSHDYMQSSCEPAPAAGGADPYDDFVKVRIALILRNHLALWDTIESCTVTGSSDSSITDVTANDMSQVLAHAPIRLICCNGATSYRLFMKYAKDPMEAWCRQHAFVDCTQMTGTSEPVSSVSDQKNSRTAAHAAIRVPEVIQLPSTSPANAAWSLPRLLQSWKIIKA